MMNAIRLVSICLLLFLGPPAMAGTIYSWTDEDGKERFSDQPPPDSITEFKTIQTAPESSSQTNSSPQRRSSYDQMIEESNRETQQSEQERRKEAAKREREEKREAEALRKARNEPERRRLEKEIQELEKRGLSTTFSLGMKRALIEKRRKRLKELE